MDVLGIGTGISEKLLLNTNRGGIITDWIDAFCGIIASPFRTFTIGSWNSSISKIVDDLLASSFSSVNANSSVLKFACLTWSEILKNVKLICFINPSTILEVFYAVEIILHILF